MAAPIVVAQVLSMISMLMQVPVIFWHSKQKNIATICMVCWLVLLNLNTFVSTIVWSDDQVTKWWNGDGYGDIFMRIGVGAGTGVLCATIANSRGLSILLSDEGPTGDPHSMRRRMEDLVISMAMPIVSMSWIIVVTPYRYGLIQYQGPTVMIDLSWPTIPLYILPPFICSLIAVGYTTLALYRYVRKRADFKDLLHTTNSGLSASRFIRFLVFVIVVTLIMLPFSIYFFVINLQSPDGWDSHYSWEGSHSQFNEVPRFNSDSATVDQWVYICLGFIQFGCFGTGKELAELYGRMASALGLGKLKKSIRNRTRRGTRRQSLGTVDSRLPFVHDMSPTDKKTHSLTGASCGTYAKSPSELSEFTVDVKMTHHSPVLTQHHFGSCNDGCGKYHPTTRPERDRANYVHDDYVDEYDRDVNQIIYGASARNRK